MEFGIGLVIGVYNSKVIIDPKKNSFGGMVGQCVNESETQWRGKNYLCATNM